METKKPAPVISSREKRESFFLNDKAEKNFEKKYVAAADIRDSLKYIRELFLMELLTSETVKPVENKEINERSGI